jgi:hypothetical protein
MTNLLKKGLTILMALSLTVSVVSVGALALDETYDGVAPIIENGNNEQPENENGEQPENENGEQPENEDGEQPENEDGEQPENEDGEQPENEDGEQPENENAEQPEDENDEQPENGYAPAMMFMVAAISESAPVDTQTVTDWLATAIGTVTDTGRNDPASVYKYFYNRTTGELNSNGTNYGIPITDEMCAALNASNQSEIVWKITRSNSIYTILCAVGGSALRLTTTDSGAAIGNAETGTYAADTGFDFTMSQYFDNAVRYTYGTDGVQTAAEAGGVTVATEDRAEMVIATVQDDFTADDDSTAVDIRLAAAAQLLIDSYTQEGGSVKAFFDGDGRRDQLDSAGENYGMPISLELGIDSGIVWQVLKSRSAVTIYLAIDADKQLPQPEIPTVPETNYSDGDDSGYGPGENPLENLNIPEEETPLAPAPEITELPEEETPLTAAPETAETTELPEETVPLAQAPETGDSRVALLSALTGILSLTGLVWLSVSEKRRAQEARLKNRIQRSASAMQRRFSYH